MLEQTRFTLSQNDLPKFWYNINADSPVKPAPVLHPGTKEPVTPDFLSVLFPMELILQEISTERFIQIPEEVQEITRQNYALGKRYYSFSVLERHLQLLLANCLGEMDR